jgi:hypothetical protein
MTTYQSTGHHISKENHFHERYANLISHKIKQFMHALFFGANISKQTIVVCTLYWLDDSTIDGMAT